MLVSTVAALSVNDKITDAGAYAGFASVVGLAVLSVLYFAQARELKRLREWAGRAPERAAEMQERIAQQGGQQRVVAQPQAQPRPPAAQPATPAGAAGATGAARPAPAGAPGVVPAATGAATAAGGAAGAAGTAGAGGGAATAAGAAGAAGAGVGTVDAARPPVDDQATQALPAVPAPGGTVPPAGGAPAGGASTPGVAGGSAARPEPAVPQRQTPPPTAVPSLRRLQQEQQPPAQDQSANRTILAVVGGGLALIAVIILLVTVVFGGGDDSSSPTSAPRTTSDATQASTSSATSSTPKTTTSSATPDPALVPANYEVTVLNGTTVTGAARQAADKLEVKGFKVIRTNQAVTSTITNTTVSYQPKSKRAALAIANQLGFPVSSVVPATPDDVVAGAGANVIVTLGSDTVKAP